MIFVARLNHSTPSSDTTQQVRAHQDDQPVANKIVNFSFRSTRSTSEPRNRPPKWKIIPESCFRHSYGNFGEPNW